MSHLRLLLFILLAWPLLSNAQQRAEHVPGEVLVRLKKEGRIADVQSELSKQLPARAAFKEVKTLGEGSRYHKIGMPIGVVSDDELLKLAARMPGVEAVSLNYKLRFNAEPNDAQYATQWNLEDINVEPVWNITTGGTMANGMRIGVGISDMPIETDHVDLQDNIWPLSPAQGNGEDHGTMVASVVGAVGNNGTGIAGVNWDVEIVSSGDAGDLSDVIEQMEFATSRREQFNNSNGANGLLVVSITASWGTPGLQACDGFTLPLFTEMTEAGIILVTSGPNETHDLDQAPEFPSSCALAEHLVVTSYGPLNEVPYATGNNSVHLLAPGLDIPVATVGNAFAVVDGNSFAVPTVAGAVALLYSIPCPSFAALVMNDPVAARTLVKNAILNNTTPFPGGNAITITGGKLNVFAAYQALMAGCVPTCSETTVTFTNGGNAPAACVLTDWRGETVATGTSGTLTACIDDGCFTAVFTDANGDPIAGTFEVTDDNGDIIAADASPNGVVEFSHGDIVPGCTTPGSGNFNPQANCDDGSCGSVTCTPIQFQIASDDFTSEGTAEVSVVSNGNVVFDGTVNISMDNGSGASLGILDLCAEPGCLSFTVESSTVALYPDGAFIINGDENSATFFSTAETFATSLGGGGEICDGLDNDCDGLVDEDFIWYVDADNDGWGLAGTDTVLCSPPSSGFAQQHGDCDDTNAEANPNMIDFCSIGDGIDNDCDGNIDEDGLNTWFLDEDGDGFGVNGTELTACEQPVGYAVDLGDCDDANAAINPGAEEVCDEIDNNCDGISDEGFYWHPDVDGDGHGNFFGVYIHSCTPVPGYVQTVDDCDDNDPDLTAINAPCNDHDPNTFPDVMNVACQCVGFPIGTCPEGEIADCNGTCAPIDWIGDGICDNGASEWNGVLISFNCPEFANDGGDCDNPCNNEVCDGADNDCDGLVDEDFTWYTDADGDEYGVDSTAVILCEGPTGPGMVQQGGDCNDADPLISPAQSELCGDGIDNNCDGVIDGTSTDFQSGCTNPLACNYDPNAFCDNGTCTLDTQPDGTEVYSPDWTLEDTDGNTVELYALLDQGHTVILDLFTTWCPPSQAMLSSGYLEEWYQHLGPDGLDHIRIVSIEMEDTATTDLVPFDELSSWPVIGRGGSAIAQLYATAGLPITAFPTVFMICPDRSITQLYRSNIDLLPGSSFNYQQEQGIALLNDLCGCHSASCTGIAGCPDPSACNYDPAATCSDGSCNAGSIWYRDQDGDGFGFRYASVIACTQPNGYVAGHGDCNDQEVTVHPGAIELCDALDNNCNGQADEGFAPVLACPGNVNVNSDTQDCSAFVAFDAPNVSCGTGFVVQTAGPESGSNFAQGSTTVSFVAFSELPTNALFSEAFANNSAGWTLGTEWQIGAAAASSTCECNSTASDDPAEDHSATADNGVAGMSIGGCIDPAVHGFSFLTSPVVDVSAVQGPLVLEFWRHLHADYAPYMEHVIEAFNGTEWIRVWTNGVEDCTNDADWSLQHVVVTNAKNAAFQVRFGQAIGEEDAFVTGGWSIDDVRFLGDLVPSSTCSFDVIVVPGTWYADADGDGFGNAAESLTQCEQPIGYVDNSSDCNDTDAAASTGQGCDGCMPTDIALIASGEWMPDQECFVECSQSSDPVSCLVFCYVDAGLGLTCATCFVEYQFCVYQLCPECEEDPNSAACLQCRISSGCHATFAECSNLTDNDLDGYFAPFDCNDNCATCTPDAVEGCTIDGLDNDCDGLVDEDALTDLDADGYTVCEGDCNDTDENIGPDATETCDGLDNDCDGLVDEGFTLYYRDFDGDGFGDPNVPLLCNADGGVTNQLDCDDNNETSYQGAPELCDDIDNDCDGAVDEGLMDDADLDGFTLCAGDCDDADADVFPGATELCDGIDNDCNGVVDESDCGIALSARVILEGPYNSSTGRMNDGMRALGLVPTVEPYSGIGYTHVGGGGEVTTPAMLATTGDDAIVDWVVLELRDAVDPSIIVATRSTLVQRDGDVVDVHGSAEVTFLINSGNYHVAVRHRNHLGCMTLNTVGLSSTATSVDFTLAALATYGTEARRDHAGIRSLWAGEVLRDGTIRYTGAGNDRDPILFTIGGAVPTNTISGYTLEDVNLDGTVQYTGANNDRDPILVTIGGSVPTAVRVEQLP